MSLGEGHHRGVRQAQIEGSEAGVDLNRPPQETSGQERDGVLSPRERGEEGPSRARAHSRAQKLVDLDEHRFGNQELSPELGHERCGKRVAAVAPVCRCDQGARVRYNPQRALARSLR